MFKPHTPTVESPFSIQKHNTLYFFRIFHIEIQNSNHSKDIEKIPFYQDGIEKGKHETLKLSVKAFHSVGYDAKKIAELLHLEEDEVVEFLK
jgi:hypothetical protein